MRSCWKLPFIHKKYFENYYKKKKNLKIKYKNSIISHYFIGKKINIYTGKTYNTINILSNMIGYKFGEFILTKTFENFIHKKKKKSKKKTKK